MDRLFAENAHGADGRNDADDGESGLPAIEQAAMASDGAVHSQSGCLVIEATRDGTIKNLTEGVNSSFELPQGDLTGCNIDKIWPGEITERLRDNIRRTLRSRQVRNDEIEDAATGKCYEFIFVARARDRVLLVARDVSGARNELSRMQALAYHDETTGLPNREYLYEQLRIITDMSRLKENRVSVMCVEIDRADLQNAAYGRTLQDSILSEIASCMARNLRGANDPEPVEQERYSIVARVDFRQFVIVLPKIEDGSEAVAVAKRISAALQEPIVVADREYRIGVHLGIALFPQDGTDPQALIENAHAAMQDAMSSRSSQFKFHSGTVRLRALQRQDLELELRTALDTDELDLNYLPIVDAQSGRTIAAEALLRWPAAVFGSQPIDHIVALAEKTGLIVSIGEWVLRRGCKQLRRWHEAGHKDLRLAVNISAQEFSRSSLPGLVAGILGECGLDPSFLDLEITEHILFRDALKDFQSCLSLKEIGVRLTVDDYGTGVCSLAHLAASPVDAVKIDNSLIAQLETGAANRAVCAAATAMARELGYKVVAEGVETKAQANIVRSQGCDYLQGFAISRPLFADDFSEFLERQQSGLELLQEP